MIMNKLGGPQGQKPKAGSAMSAMKGKKPSTQPKAAYKAGSSGYVKEKKAGFNKIG